jgi:hypothetical protein
MKRLAIVGLLLAGSTLAVGQEDTLARALSFHASFDRGVDAARAGGDPRLYWAPSFKERASAKPGVPDDGTVRRVDGRGVFGSALQFTKKGSPIVFYRGAGNMPYEAANWQGTVSFWLSVDRENELEDGFCDPLQITPRAWNDAALFVEFEKRPDSVPFRLGAYADFDVWNPGKRRFADIPAQERPLITVDDPPFSRGRWTHVAFTFQNFNTKRADGMVRLYIDGRPHGELGQRVQTFTWNPEENVIALGLNYVGLFDELSTFNRALADAEVAALHRLPGGVSSLLR